MMTREHDWVRVSLGMFAVGFGANLFSALMPSYKHFYNFTQAHVTFLLAVYVLGLIPTLLLSGPLSDVYGRRAVIRPAMIVSAIGSLILLAGVVLGFGALLVGRFLVGASMGMVLAAGASWLKEISAGPAAVSARRATVAITAGFASGPLCSGCIAEWLPAPDVVPYVVHIVLIVVVTVVAWNTPEAVPSTATAGGGTSPERVGVSAGGGDDAALTTGGKAGGVAIFRGRLFSRSVLTPRFLWAVAAWAPWVFGAATTSFSVLPALVRVEWTSAYSGLIAALTLGSGLLVQPWAQRLGNRDTVAPAIVGLVLIFLGMGASVLVALSNSPLSVFPAAILLGASYGVMMVSGLREVQEIAPPHELGAATAIYYSLTYAGFFVPFILSYIGPAIGYEWAFVFGAMVAVASIVPVAKATANASVHARATG
ncbi:MFS transporter [Corynebacterium anserum]|nr:MFS transporter [Corynebacterium anserum]